MSLKPSGSDGRPLSAGKNAAVLMLAEVVSRMLGLAAFAVIARAVGPRGFGLLNLSLGILAFLALAADPGLQYVAQRSFVKGAGDQLKLVSRVTTLRVSLAFVALVIAATMHLVWGSQLTWLVLLYAVSLLPSALSLAWLFTANERMSSRAWGQTVGATAFVLWAVALVRDASDIALVPLGLVVANGASALVLWMRAPASWQSAASRYATDDVRSLVSSSLPFGATLALAQLLVWLDSFLLAAFVSAEEIGLYHAAYRWVLLVVGVGIYFPQALFPGMVRRAGSANGLRVFEEAARVTCVAGMFVALVLCGTASILVGRLFGSAFAEAIPLLLIVAWVVPLTFHNSLAAHYLNANGRERLALAITAAVVVSNLVFNLLLIPKVGAAGAAVALLLSEATSALLCVSATRAMGVPAIRTYSTVALASGASVVTFLLLPGPLPAKAAAAAGALLLVLVVHGEMGPSRLRELRALFWIGEAESNTGLAAQS